MESGDMEGLRRAWQSKLEGRGENRGALCAELGD